MSTEFYRLEVTYMNGSVEYPTHSDESKAKTMRVKYLSMPSVRTVELKKIIRVGHLTKSRILE